jgi:cell division protein FtsB
MPTSPEEGEGRLRRLPLVLVRLRLLLGLVVWHLHKLVQGRLAPLAL